MKRFDWLIQMIKQHDFRRGAEIGTGSGVTGRFLMQGCPKLHLVQVAYYPNRPGDYQDHTLRHKRIWARRIQPFVSAGRVTVLPWKSHVASYCIADGSLDFVFIDADHHYPHVIEDIRDWFPKIRSGGLISGHDFAHPDYPDWGVEKAVREYFGDNFEATGHDFVWFSWKS